MVSKLVKETRWGVQGIYNDTIHERFYSTPAYKYIVTHSKWIGHHRVHSGCAFLFPLLALGSGLEALSTEGDSPLFCSSGSSKDAWVYVTGNKSPWGEKINVKFQGQDRHRTREGWLNGHSPEASRNWRNRFSQLDSPHSLTSFDTSKTSYSGAVATGVSGFGGRIGFGFGFLPFPLVDLEISKSIWLVMEGISSTSWFTSDTSADKTSSFNEATVVDGGTVKNMVSLWVFISSW